MWISIAFVPLLFVTAEAILRLWWAEPLKLRESSITYLNDSRLGYRYAPGSSGRICFPGVEKDFVTNSHGYLGPDFTFEKRNGAFRIVVIGSSDATGLWLDDDEPYPMLLQSLLRRRGVDGEVLNLSIDGIGRDYAKVLQAEEEALLYGPDLILLQIRFPFPFITPTRKLYRGYSYFSGYSGMSAWERQRLRTTVQALIDAVESGRYVKAYRASYLFRAISIRWIERGGGKSAQVAQLCSKKGLNLQVELHAPPESITDSVARVRLACDRINETGANLVLLHYGTKSSWAQDLTAAEIPAVYLNLSNDRRLYHKYDGHLNRMGHQLVADRLMTALDPWLPSALSEVRESEP